MNVIEGREVRIKNNIYRIHGTRRVDDFLEIKTVPDIYICIYTYLYCCTQGKMLLTRLNDQAIGGSSGVPVTCW